MSTAWHQNGEAALHHPPYVLRWDAPTNPVPVRTVRLLGRRSAHIPVMEPPPWLSTGPTGEPFDFTNHMRRLCVDIVARCETLCHVDLSRLLLGVTQARSNRAHGLQARVTPLRFRHGNLIRQRGSIQYQVQRYVVDQREVLYLMTFCLPRFLNQGFDDKFITLFHELYHIGPEFDGDLRRHDGRYALHSHSQRSYDEHMSHLARAYLASKPDASLHAFLRLDFAQLQRRHGSVIGVMMPRPKLIPVPPRKMTR